MRFVFCLFIYLFAFNCFYVAASASGRELVLPDNCFIAAQIHEMEWLVEHRSKYFAETKDRKKLIIQNNAASRGRMINQLKKHYRDVRGCIALYEFGDYITFTKRRHRFNGKQYRKYLIGYCVADNPKGRLSYSGLMGLEVELKDEITRGVLGVAGSVGRKHKVFFAPADVLPSTGVNQGR